MDIITLLTKYLNNEEIQNPTYDEKLIEEAKMHSLLPLLYTTHKIKEYRKYYLNWIIKQQQFNILQEEITKLFNDNNIPHIYFKGTILTNLYDDSSIRTRGDIDLYISNKDFELARKLLLDNNYKVIDADCMHHLAFIKNDIDVELHYEMIEEDSKKEWVKFLKEPFKLCDKNNNNHYYFSDTNHFIYCMIHFAYHLRSGAGLRYLLDFYYMFKNSNIDFPLLHQTLDKLKLNQLYSNIVNSLRLLSNKDFDSNVSKEDITFFIDYLKSSGIHGHDMTENMQTTRHHNKLKTIISRVFLTNRQYRLAMYPKLGKHWYLYPLCFIVHFIYLLTHRLKGLFLILFGKNKNKHLYKKLGV